MNLQTQLLKAVGVDASKVVKAVILMDHCGITVRVTTCVLSEPPCAELEYATKRFDVVATERKADAA